VSAAVGIRTAAVADVAAIAAIYAEAVQTGTASWELAPPDEATMRERMRSILGAGYPYLVAGDGNAIAGYAYASAFRPRAGYRHTVEDSIYVAREARGRGVGNALLGALIDACAKAGYRQMVAVIGGRDELPSIRLHAAHGFVDVGTLPAIGRKFGRWLDCVHMQRALGEGAMTPPTVE
jgi:L-amino acid N-acyltransferase YncA